MSGTRHPIRFVIEANFLEKLDYVPMTRDASIIFFSLSGFSEYVQENAENYTLVDVDEMFAPL